MPKIAVDIILSEEGIGCEVDDQTIVFETWNDMLDSVEEDLFGDYDSATLTENISDWNEISESMKLFAEDISDLIDARLIR